MNEISRQIFTYCLWLNSATAMPTEQLPEKIRVLSGQLAHLLMGEHAGASSQHYFAVTGPQGRMLFIVLLGEEGGRHGDSGIQYLALFSAVNAGVSDGELSRHFGLLDFIRVGGNGGRTIEPSHLNLSFHPDGNTLQLILFTQGAQVGDAGRQAHGYGELHYRIADTRDSRIEPMP